MKTAMIKPNYHLAVLFIVVMAFLLCAWPVSGKTALGSSNVSEIGVLENTISKSLTALGKSIVYRSRALGNSNVPEDIPNTSSSGHVGSSSDVTEAGRANPINPSNRQDNCTACVSATVINRLDGRGADELLTADDVERLYGFTGTSRGFSPADSISFVENATGTTGVRAHLFSESAEVGNYAITVERRSDSMGHIVFGERLSNGESIIYDPQVDRYLSIDEFTNLYKKSQTFFLQTAP